MTDHTQLDAAALAAIAGQVQRVTDDLTERVYARPPSAETYVKVVSSLLSHAAALAEENAALRKVAEALRGHESASGGEG